MKSFVSIVLLLALCCLLGCSKDCSNDLATCSERPPTDEACLAYFSRWFYNSTTNQCEQKGYSGCSQKGFATEADCEACLCH